MALSLVALSVAAIGVWTALLSTGYPPARWIEYAERRLQGHPKLEAAAEPFLTGFRMAVGEELASGQLAQPFKAPPPPPRWAADAAAPLAEVGAGPGRTLRVGPGEPVQTIAEAARLARDGDVVEIVAGDYRGDVAFWPQRLLTIRGVGGNARIFADGRSSQGKAIWVLRGGVIDISNIDFVGARVGDRNGAGLRVEGGWVTVRNCLFWDSESGILVANAQKGADVRLEVHGSEFGYLGDGVGKAHGIYAGAIARLTVTGSYFHHGNVGHLIKSRAQVTDLRYNRISDEAGGHASYQVDIPNGGRAVLVGNLIQQGAGARNGTLVSFGAEGYRAGVNLLFLMNNTLVNDLRWGGAHLRVRAGATQVTVANNVRVGQGRYHGDDALQVFNDTALDRGDFVNAQQFDFRLPTTAAHKLTWVAPRDTRVDGMGLVPDAQYEHPRRVRPASTLPIAPGAHPWPVAEGRAAAPSTESGHHARKPAPSPSSKGAGVTSGVRTGIQR